MKRAIALGVTIASVVGVQVACDHQWNTKLFDPDAATEHFKTTERIVTKYQIHPCLVQGIKDRLLQESGACKVVVTGNRYIGKRTAVVQALCDENKNPVVYVDFSYSHGLKIDDISAKISKSMGIPDIYRPVSLWRNWLNLLIPPTTPLERLKTLLNDVESADRKTAFVISGFAALRAAADRSPELQPAVAFMTQKLSTWKVHTIIIDESRDAAQWWKGMDIEYIMPMDRNGAEKFIMAHAKNTDAKYVVDAVGCNLLSLRTFCTHISWGDHMDVVINSFRDGAYRRIVTLWSTMNDQDKIDVAAALRSVKTGKKCLNFRSIQLLEEAGLVTVDNGKVKPESRITHEAICKFIDSYIK